MALRFSNGMLGVAVVAVALAAAIMGSWALSTEVNEVQVTNYNSIADISGLFEGTKAPEYINYNPSTNYTGYHTTDPQYFDGVEFGESARANSYRLNLQPVIESDGTLTLSDYNGTYPFDDEDHNITFAYIDSDNGFERSHLNSTSTTVTLSSYVLAMNLDPSVNRLIIKSESNIQPSDVTYGEMAEADWILFTVLPAWWGSGSAYSCAVYTEEYLNKIGYAPGSINPLHGNQINLPLLSCIVDITSNQAYLYTDNDCQNLYNIYTLSDVIMSYGGTHTGNQLYINFADTADYSAEISETKYMDPSKGVELSE